MLPMLLTTVGIANASLPAASLVVWPALYELVALFSSPVTDWESVTATALRRNRRDRSPRRVTGWLAAGFAGLLAAVVSTELGGWYLRTLINVPQEPAELGIGWAGLLLPIPVLWAVRAYLRGVTMAAGTTGWLLWASGAHVLILSVTVVMLGLTRLPGVAVGGVALLAGLLADLVVTSRGAVQAAAVPAHLGGGQESGRRGQPIHTD